MTKKEFLDRARDVHGYKYQYPNLSDKVLSNDNIDIIYNGVLYRQKVSCVECVERPSLVR